MQTVKEPRPIEPGPHAAAAGIGVRIAAVLCVLACLGGSASAAFGVWIGGEELAFGLAQAVLALVYATVGFRLVARHPRNAVGWILLLVGFCQGASGGGYSFGMWAHGRGWPLAAEIVWVANWIWAPSLALLAVGLPALFPDGRPLSRAWGGMVAIAGLATVVGTGAHAAGGWQIRHLVLTATRAEFEAVEAQIPAVYERLFGLSLAVMVLCAVAAIASVVVRFRRSRGLQRAQLKWFTFGGSLTVVGTGLTFVVPPPDSLAVSLGWFPVMLGALIAAPVAVGIAVLRYHLYDIDRVVSRTVSYGLLTAALLLVYAGGVLLVGPVLTPIDGGSQVTVALSTLAAVTLFQPLRRRVQTVVDRRFNRARYDAQRVVQALASRLRDEVDLGTLRHHLLGAVDATVAPSYRDVWLLDRSHGHRVDGEAGPT